MKGECAPLPFVIYLRLKLAEIGCELFCSLQHRLRIPGQNIDMQVFNPLIDSCSIWANPPNLSEWFATGPPTGSFQGCCCPLPFRAVRATRSGSWSPAVLAAGGLMGVRLLKRTFLMPLSSSLGRENPRELQRS